MSDLTLLAERKDFERVLAGFREHTPTDVLAIADWLREEDVYHVAIELYRWLLDQVESAAVHFGIGQCYGKIYDFDAALKHLDIAFALEPERSEGASYYAYVLERHERMADADRWYRAALAGDEVDNLWARSHYAWFLEKRGRTQEACLRYTEALRRNPAFTWASKRYAMLLRRLGEPDRALALLCETCDRAPGNRVAEVNLLEYILLSTDVEYPAMRATLDPTNAPDWYPVVVEMFDYYRDHLLTGRPDPVRLAAWEQAADGLPESVHRDFEDLNALLVKRGGDIDAWRDMIKRLLK